MQSVQRDKCKHGHTVFYENLKFCMKCFLSNMNWVYNFYFSGEV